MLARTATRALGLRLDGWRHGLAEFAFVAAAISAAPAQAGDSAPPATAKDSAPPAQAGDSPPPAPADDVEDWAHPGTAENSPPPAHSQEVGAGSGGRNEVPGERPVFRFPADDAAIGAVGERRFGLGTAAMHLDFVHARESVKLAGLSDYVLGGLSFRALYGKRIAYAPGLDLALGGGGAAGFALDVVLFPAGIAVAFGPTGYFGVRVGVGASGVTERIPITLVLPAEARLEFDVGRRARLGFSGGFGWTPAEGGRQGGSAMVPFADESFLAVTARFGRTFPNYGSTAGRGPFFRLERREQMKTALFGISIGYEVDMAQ